MAKLNLQKGFRFSFSAHAKKRKQAFANLIKQRKIQEPVSSFGFYYHELMNFMNIYDLAIFKKYMGFEKPDYTCIYGNQDINKFIRFYMPKIKKLINR